MKGVERASFHTRDGLILAGDIGGASANTTVVLMHGAGQTRHSWSSEMHRLMSDGYCVVSYDARGHGESQWAHSGDYSIRALASDLDAILAIIAGPFALVGASMGGMTAFYSAGTRALANARALVLVDMVVTPARKGAENISRFMSANPNGFATLEEAVDAVAAYNPARARPANISGLSRNLRRREDGRFYWHWDPRLIESTPTSEPPSLSKATLSACTSVTLPTLLVRGGRSDIVDDAGIAEMRALVPQCEIYDVQNAGHMIAGDDNGAFHDGIIGFLRRHAPPVL